MKSLVKQSLLVSFLLGTFWFFFSLPLNILFTFIEKIIKDGMLSPRASIAGKPLIIHAAINDKAEMLLLLASYGAMIKDPICNQGKNIMEYAVESKAIHAQAQIILIRA